MSQIADKDGAWKTLYRVGGTAPLVALGFYVTQVLAIALGDTILGVPLPATMEDWFLLLQRSRIVGLLYLNALDIFSVTLVGTMLLALCVALRRVNQSATAIAAFVAVVGVAVFVAPRASMTAATLSLSDQYAAATTEAHKLQLVTAGEAMSAATRATPQTTGFLFLAIAGLIISAVILQSDRLAKAAGYVGILASAITSADHACLVIAPSVASILMPLDGLLWLIWWIMISWGLFRLSRANPEEEG
jgi:hypothetical protein